jgi:hypothetical protein
VKQRHYLDTPRVAQAIDELTSRILSRYPEADITISEGEDPDGVYITAMVDVEDPDEVTDLIIERTLALQVDEHLPVYVIPIRAVQRMGSTARESTSTLSSG